MYGMWGHSTYILPHFFDVKDNLFLFLQTRYLDCEVVSFTNLKKKMMVKMLQKLRMLLEELRGLTKHI